MEKKIMAEIGYQLSLSEAVSAQKKTAQKKIGGLAIQLRKSQGKSVRGIAKKMGISAQYLSDLERGNRNWTEKTVKLWRKAISE